MKACAPGQRYYYRLKQLDRDGRFAYSDVRTANAHEQRVIDVGGISQSCQRHRAWPAPKLPRLLRAELELLDMNGRVVLRQQNGCGCLLRLVSLKFQLGLYVLRARYCRRRVHGKSGGRLMG